jgi:hypothetical protein
MGLVQLMDHIHTIGDEQPMQRWLDWKSSNADMFATVS